MSLKVLIISSYTDTWNSVRPEAEIFIGLANQGFDLTIMTEESSAYVTRFKEHGINIINYHPKKKISWQAITFIRQILIREQYDILYLFNNKAITNGLFASIGLPVKAISYRGQTGNMHRYDPACYLTHFHPRLDAIVCVANAIRDDLQKQAFVKKDNIVTIYKGHSLDWYQETAGDLTEFGIPHNAFVIGCVANNRPRKGISVLLKATHYLCDKDNIHLLLIGSNMDCASIKMLVAESPMHARIHVAGFREDTPKLIAACDISVLPSLKREGLPKTVIEAMAYGVTPIVSNTGGSAELVEHGVSGMVTEPGNARALAYAIESLWQNQDQCQAMGQKAKQRLATHFTLEKSIIETGDFFHQLMERK